MSWKKTLHLPKSDFPARAQVHDRAKYIQRCTDDLYTWQRRRQLPQTFVLQDGPPYANGELHIGHALNKVLKDIICRSRLPTHRIDWRPGWDCHGLPIELKALQQRESTSNNAVSIRGAARRLATQTVQDQEQSFRKWGIMADWSHAWTTMDKDYEIKQLGVFKAMAGKGLIYRKFRPVHWSPSSRTALAEAELEYRDDHVSTAAFVKYPLKRASENSKKLDRLGVDLESASAVIWTTTPWTLPANRAIGIHKDIEYTIAQSLIHGRLLVASSRLSELEHYLNESLHTIVSFDGESIIGMSYTDETFDVNSPPRPFIHADFISETSGSGLVHLAPGHGMDDYELCSKHKIRAFAPVDDKGLFTSTACPEEPDFLLGKEVLGAGNRAVLSRLKTCGQLLAEHPYTHNYPYDWRSKQPLIVRATEQWFANVDDIQSNALEALQSVQFIPSTSKTRLQSFVRNRSEWCISRQRAWGVPIPALYHKETNEALLTWDSISHIISVISKRGVDAWWTDDDLDPAWTPPSLRSSDGHSLYRRGKDTMDVWFDSGTSWTQTGPNAGNDCFKPDDHVADCYIEGTDQHRGWFQSSLLTHIADQCCFLADETRAAAPFRTLITHGFTLDQEGRKMSKSVGNVISSDEIMEGTLLPMTRRTIKGKSVEFRDGMGPDALRLWVASCDYTKDVRVSQTMLQAINGNLAKYRVTFKLLLGLLKGFDPASYDFSQHMGMVHRIALMRLKDINTSTLVSYHSFDFSKAARELNAYVINDLSSRYFEWIKDAAYCGTPEERLQVQATVHQIYRHLRQMLAPITPLLVEEAWDYTPKQIQDYMKRPPGQHSWTEPRWNSSSDIQLEADVPLLMKALATVKGTLETVRLAEKIGGPLETYACFETRSTKALDLLHRYDTHQLESLFGVSSMRCVGDINNVPELRQSDWSHTGTLEMFGDEVSVHLYQPQLAKCARCWRYAAPVGSVDEALCGRCEGVVQGITKEDPEVFPLE